MALCLPASIPCGPVDVVNIRSEILGNLVGPGWCQKSSAIPTVGHPTDVSMSTLYGTRVIYVGHPRGALQCTPWVNPCSMADFVPFKFKDYCSSRADCDEWSKPLFGCHLVCSCKFHGLMCHARYLQRDQQACDDVKSMLGPCDDSVEFDDARDEVDHLGGITAPDETLIGQSMGGPC